jgi:hypothetical protein
MDSGRTSNTGTAPFKRYQDYLASLPPPGGNGCHVALLGAANLGVMAGVPAEQIFSELKSAIPAGGRRVTDREIADAVNRAVADQKVGAALSRIPRPEPLVSDPASILRSLIDQEKDAAEADLWEASPTRIDWPPEEDAMQILQMLYDQDDLIFIGERYSDGILDDTIRTSKRWVEYLCSGGKTAPHLIPNPLNGRPVPTKSGDTRTLRGDSNVTAFRFCVVEFDNLSLADQLSFWFSVNLPISALIDSGGKSIHGWLDVRRLADVATGENWDHHIKNRLYAQALVPLGVDSACSNPSRLSRLPGHFREGSRRQQRLLYLSPEGGRVA